MAFVVQAHEFLAPGPKRRRAPEGWWKKAINPPKPKPKETVLEIGAPATATQAAKPGAVKGAMKGANRSHSRKHHLSCFCSSFAEGPWLESLQNATHFPPM